MGNRAIVADKLSKRYRLGSGAHHYGRLTESLSNAVTAPFRSLFGGRRESHTPDYLWALRDASFEIEEGEAVGIIGGNGAGKTTLLKILSRITDPTEGRATLNGRVASLLEVGTGFHPELTGRENVYLNGATLGMPKSQINRRFDEIVDFSEMGSFLETPLKRYSSGMQVRLAFAVAAHLEPEVLIVDEVLAVGDVKFQRKCLGKMGDVASEGRTVLFVSHNMSVVSRLCRRGIWLEQGKIAAQGPMEDVVRQYLMSSAEERAEFREENLERAPGNEDIRLRAVCLRDNQGRLVSAADARNPLFVEMEYVVFKRSPLHTAFKLLNAEGVVLFTSSDMDDERRVGLPRDPGVYISRWEIPPYLLRRGLYFVSVHSSVVAVKVNFRVDNIVSFTVDVSDDILDSDGRPGVLAPALSWEIERVSGEDEDSRQRFAKRGLRQT